MHKQKGFTLFEMSLLLIAIFGVIGWIMNVVKVVAAFSCPITLELVFRIICVFFFPIGAVMGYIPSGANC